MDELLEFVPEDKREAFKAKATGYVKLTDELALDYVKKSQSLTDKVATPIAEARFKRYQEEQLPKLLEAEREKTRAETRKEFEQKPETAEQKELREMREWKQRKEAEELVEQKKAALRKKAAELKFDPLKAERFAALPDAEAVIEELAKEYANFGAEIEKLKTQVKYGSNPPPAQRTDGAVMPEAEFNKLSPKAKADFMAKGGRVE